MAVTPRDFANLQFRFLFFRPIKISVRRDFWPWFSYVTLVTLIVGIGRYWDHPTAELWQHIGLGSLGYIFCLSLLIYIVVWPLRPVNWQYRGVLIFVGLTSLPAVLYAVPVEQFMELQTAQKANAWFLGLVALWRVALFLRYLTTSAGLHWFLACVVAAVLLSGIVVVLAILNLEHVVFDLMAGIRPENAGPNDIAYTFVFGLAIFAMYTFPVVMILYLGGIVQRWQSRTG